MPVAFHVSLAEFVLRLGLLGLIPHVWKVTIALEELSIRHSTNVCRALTQEAPTSQAPMNVLFVLRDLLAAPALVLSSVHPFPVLSDITARQALLLLHSTSVRTGPTLTARILRLHRNALIVLREAIVLVD